jgi:transposase
MFSTPKAFPLEFRRDVAPAARKGEAPLPQIAKDSGISESCVHRWLKLTDIDGVRPGMTSGESAELRRRNRTLEQGNEILRRGVLRRSRQSVPVPRFRALASNGLTGWEGPDMP